MRTSRATVQTNHDLDQLAIELFKTFARFEYALKATGYHKGNGPAEPDWRRFAENISEVFKQSTDVGFDEAVNYILNNPPKKQVIIAGKLDWIDYKPTTNLRSDLVLLYVRCVRNNLFHGGKFNRRWFEPDRSELLLQHSLTILRKCLDSSPALKRAFAG